MVYITVQHQDQQQPDLQSDNPLLKKSKSSTHISMHLRSLSTVAVQKL